MRGSPASVPPSSSRLDILQPFCFQEEEFSTLTIENEFDKKNKKHNDDLAASVILENFLKNKSYAELENLQKIEKVTATVDPLSVI